jgi:hypothetical protein
MSLVTNDYFEIGRKEGLEGFRLKVYVNFMLIRFPQEGCRCYAQTWAHRFFNGEEYVYADENSRTALIKAQAVSERILQLI